MNILIKNFQKWIRDDNQRLSLQRVYLTLAVVSLMVAGIISLVNHQLGTNVAAISIASSVLFLTNSVAWVIGEALLNNLFGDKTISISKKRSKK